MSNYHSDMHHFKDEVYNKVNREANTQVANEMATIMNYKLHAEQLFVPLLKEFEVLKPNNPKTLLVAKHNAFFEQFVTDGALGNDTFEQRLELVIENVKKYMKQQGMQDPDKNYFYFKDLDNGTFKFKVYVQDMVFKQGEEEKFIRQLNAFFHEPKFNDFYQVSLSVGPFLMPSEIVKIGEVDLENDRLTASLNNMFNVILENLKYRGE